MHNEINAWQHILNVLYREALRRGLIEKFLEILSLPLQATDSNQVRPAAPSTSPFYLESAGSRATCRQSELLQKQHKVFQEAIARATASYSVESNSGKTGCQLAFLAKRIREHYNDKEKRATTYPQGLLVSRPFLLPDFPLHSLMPLKWKVRLNHKKSKNSCFKKGGQVSQGCCNSF